MIMAKEKFLVVPAGGSGQRMGTTLPKQFLLLDGKPILRLTIERFMEAVPDIHIITVLPESGMAFWKNYCAAENFICPQKIVEGGFTRFHSVKNALEYVPDNALVAVHDAVRPLVGVETIRELFEEAEKYQAVIPVTPSFDTLATVENTEEGLFVAGTPDRSRIYSVQTPQVFNADILKKAYLQPYDTLFTDDASVVARNGVKVKCIPSSRTNIKITTPLDLDLAAALLPLVR